jgi:hypothetical protein
LHRCRSEGTAESKPATLTRNEAVRAPLLPWTVGPRIPERVTAVHRQHSARRASGGSLETFYVPRACCAYTRALNSPSPMTTATAVALNVDMCPMLSTLNALNAQCSQCSMLSTLNALNAQCSQRSMLSTLNALNAQCPMPNAQCSMLNAQCPMPNAECSPTLLSVNPHYTIRVELRTSAAAFLGTRWLHERSYSLQEALSLIWDRFLAHSGTDEHLHNLLLAVVARGTDRCALRGTWNAHTNVHIARRRRQVRDPSSPLSRVVGARVGGCALAHAVAPVTWLDARPPCSTARRTRPPCTSTQRQTLFPFAPS